VREQVYLDGMDNPTIPNHVSYHKLVKKLDERGFEIEWAYFDTAGNLTRKYDREGNLVE